MQTVSSCVCCGCGNKILPVAGIYRMKIVFEDSDFYSLEVIEIAKQFLLYFDRCDNCGCEGCPECNFLGVVQVRNADGTEFG
ncbi:TPA: hypothetical protein MFD56_000489 [Klebsiella pneumoniae]|uniref:hypothetical protein n=1 Tax=Klebsiella TaxID=570 RepID=UPI00191A2D00|nr:hypothetical protein [Klebsiella pneumoniae]HBW7442349.1 hypothetical protein [Klebsiella pneumoniae]HBW7485671.1 hypothetical protein [Klebsiella pneumoniae]HBW7776307.1 hypothetical protein [Klebsiella pneumoniae]HBW7780460.1 hypothetical protein [Klebsiella pneumoniae]HBW7987572.1 hypothetical protein [Klebsiella pneumoniae]